MRPEPVVIFPFTFLDSENRPHFAAGEIFVPVIIGDGIGAEHLVGIEESNLRENDPSGFVRTIVTSEANKGVVGDGEVDGVDARPIVDKHPHAVSGDIIFKDMGGPSVGEFEFGARNEFDLRILIQGPVDFADETFGRGRGQR